MCFNASLVQTAEIMAVELNGYIDDSQIKPVYFTSAFSLPQWPVLTDSKPDQFCSMKWGLIPSWIKNYESAREIRFKTFNARIETIHEKASFKYASDNGRCAVPVDGWFEWKEINGKKYPYYIYRQDKKPFLLAGLWDKWLNRENNKIYETFSVITTKAQGLCSEIHNTKERMPFILSQNDRSIWLNKELKYSDLRNEINPEWEELKAHPVSNLLTSKHKDKNVPQVQEKTAGPPNQLILI